MEKYQNLNQFYKLLENLPFDPELSNYKQSLIQEIDTERVPLLKTHTFFVFDVIEKQIVHFGNNFETFLGYQKEVFNLAFFMNLIHPDDSDCIHRLTIKSLIEGKKHQVTEVLDYVICFDYRVRKSDGMYIRLLQETSVIKKDKKGNIILVVIAFTDITKTKRTDNIEAYYTGSDMKLYNFPGNCLQKKKYSIFTEREIEILKLIADGNSNNEIAEILHISPHTLKTHKKQMLDKTNAKKMTVLLLMAQKEGYI